MKKLLLFTTGLMFLLISCGGGSKEEEFDHVKYGYGPITKVALGPIDQALADKGKSTFEVKCTACHKIETRYVAPKLGGVTKRRTPEFIMNMILNPAEMVQKNPETKKLLAEYNVAMTFQNVTKDDARAILEYFRTCEDK